MVDGVVGKIIGGRFVSADLQNQMSNLIKAGLACTLTEADFDAFDASCKAVSWHDTSELYIRKVSHVVFTVEWIESFVHLVGQGSTVEYASPNPLEQAMEDRGLTWGSPKSRDDTDLIFYPWVSPVVPYISAQILKEHIPIVIIASPKAIDRIREIWADTDEPYRMVPVVDAFDWFSDVRCWPDFEAQTWVILPSGTALIVNDVCLAGPGRKRQTVYSD